MLKILLVYYEPLPSGQTTHVLSLARGLDRTRYAVTVVLPDTLTGAIEEFRQSGVKVVPLAMGKIRWSLKAIAALARLVRSERYAVVHVHSQEAGAVARLVCWLAGAERIFYTPQTIDIRKAWLRPWYQVSEVVLSWLTECIFSVNQVDRERLIGWGIDRRKIVTLPNGLDFGDFHDAPPAAQLRQVMGLPAEGPLVMQVGRLAPQKDPLAFVEGAARVLRQHPNAQFVMVGEGPQLAETQALIRLKQLDQQVRLLGRQPDAYRLMAAADVVTLTSRWEGTPYSIMEAMAWRKPVVVTAVNGCQELVLDGKTGVVVAAGDTTAWAEGVSALLSDARLRQRMGEQGYQRVHAQYSLESMLALLEDHYRHCSKSAQEKAAEPRRVG